MPRIAPWMLVALGLVTLLAVITTAWSVGRDLRAYRAWRREQATPPPRWRRRQRHKAGLNEDQDGQRWRWLILSLQCAAFGLIGGVSGVLVGYFTRRAWLMVTGGNLLVLSMMIWVAYQLVLPKPSALRPRAGTPKE